MKVLIAIPCLLQGGTEMQTLSLVKVLRSYGLAVLIVCYFEHSDLMVIEFRNAGAVVKLLNLRRSVGPLKIISILYKKIRSAKTDIIHVQYMTPGALPIIAARLAGVKTVFATAHQPYTMLHGRLAKLILRSVSLLTDKFIAVSQNAEKSWFGTSHLFDENQPANLQLHHFTIYNSVDTDKIQNITEATDSQLLKNELQIPEGVPLIGAVSRLSHEKGIDLLIEAFSLLAKKDNNAHLLIVGSGTDEGKMKDQAVSLEISDRITFYGYAEWETAMKLISIMDIVVVPSRFEGFGLIATEAMAAGKPVVASDNFGLKEVVVDRETGLSFKSENIYDLKEKLKILLNDPVLCSQYGAAGQERVRRLFDTSVFQKRIASLYNINFQEFNPGFIAKQV